MALEQFYGRMVDMVRRTDGDELTVAAGIAETVLHVGDTADFDETGGIVEIDGTRYTYTSLDHDANTITLDTGLLVAAEVGDRVDVVDEELDAVVVEYVANVLLEDQDPGDEPIEVTVQHGLVNYLAEQVRGGYAESVTLLRDGDDDLVIWQVEGKLVVDIALEARLGPVDTDLANLNADLAELNTVTLPGLQADLAANEAQVATLNGLFPITSTSITDGAITTPKMTADSINGDRITANTLNASKIVAGSISTDRMTVNTINGDRILTNTLHADRIVANSITGDKIAANAIDGKTITGANLVNVGGGWGMTGPGLIGPSFTTTINNVGDAVFNGSMHADSVWADAYAGGSNSGADIGADGKLKRTTSSRRYKTDIREATVDTDAVLGLIPKMFVRIDETSGREYLGLIAEEVAGAGLDDLVFDDAEGQVDGIHYNALTVALLAALQSERAARLAQQGQIDDLTARIEALEAA